MSRKSSLILAVLSLAGIVLVTGCNPTAEMSLKFSPDQTTTYNAVSEVVKDFRFEQPNLNKLREEQTKTVIDMTYDQTVTSVDEEGMAEATITIKSLKVTMVNKNELRFSYDSEKDTKSPMSKLLGASYTISMAPDGTAKALDTQNAAKLISSGFEKKIADSILDGKSIEARHSVPALPREGTISLAKNATWTQTVPSPPGLLAPKNYQKTYTLTDMSKQDGVTVATVSMTAGEAAEAAAGAMNGGMGIFAKMFDNEDTYTGSMTLDVDSGSVLTMDETLVSTYLAQEMPEKGDPEKGPDMLTMRFTNIVKLEKLD